MSNLPTVERKNTLTIVKFNKLSVVFSYETPIAFWGVDGKTIATENVWSNTTGKHLNIVSNKADRIPFDEFNKKLEEELRKFNLV
jgi:hypothetical protein